jgi:hypothetical protein
MRLSVGFSLEQTGGPVVCSAAMKMIALNLAAAMAVLLSSCVSHTPQSRIERNPQLFNALSAKDRQLVSQGLIREGLTKDGVFIAWGAPDTTTVGRKGGLEIEEWTYLGQRAVRTMTMNVGMGWGHPYGGCGPWGWGGYGPWGWGGPGWGSGVTYVPYTAGVVTFRSGRVTEWQAARR